MSTNRQTVLRSLHVKYPKGFSTGSHHHDWHQLVFSADGAGKKTGVMTVETEDGVWLVPAGDAIWIRADTEHDVICNGSVDMRTLYFEPAVVVPNVAACQILEVPPLFRELIAHVCKTGFVELGDERSERLYGFVLDQLQTLQPKNVTLPFPKDERARKFARLILTHENYHVSLSQIAKESGASDRTMHRLFVNEVGLSPGKWRHRSMMIEAARRLATQNVTEVSLSLGFQSLSAFVQSFRTFYNQTPGAFSKAQRS